MKAMLLSQNAAIETAPLSWADVPDPLPGPGQVRLKVRCCAICRTDLHVIEGDLPPQKRPVIPGHQIVGVVDTIGPGCRRFEAGMRIGAAWLRHTCGICRFCTSGRENLCESSLYTGYQRDIHPVTANTRQDGRELLSEATAAGVRPRTKSYPLREANQAIRDLKEGRIDGTGVLII